MNKREIDITELMDNYTDNEFNIGGEAGAEAEKVVSTVLQQVKQKKKVKPLFKVIAAAAAAVVLAGAVTAATIAIRGGYETLTGLDVEYWMEGDNGGYSISMDADRELPVKLDGNNRLLFSAGGQDTDITDLVDGDTPYIYSYTNTEGNECYVVVGGAAGDYGYLDLVPIKVSEEYTSWNVIGHNTVVNHHADEERRSMFKPWCLAAFDELGIWDNINCITDTDFDPAAENGGFGEVFNAEYYGH